MNPGPTYGGILYGGASRRMGRPKQLLQRDGVSLCRRLHDQLAPFVERVVLLGEGTLPPDLPDLDRVADPPGVKGPMAGLLAALRHAPGVSWILCACDMPNVDADAVTWLLDQAGEGALAVLPRLPGGSWCEPLFAWYGAAVAVPAERLAAEGVLRPGLLIRERGVIQPEVPADLIRCWDNLNRAEDLPEGIAFPG